MSLPQHLTALWVTGGPRVPGLSSGSSSRGFSHSPLGSKKGVSNASSVHDRQVCYVKSRVKGEAMSRSLSGRGTYTIKRGNLTRSEGGMTH